MPSSAFSPLADILSVIDASVQKVASGTQLVLQHAGSTMHDIVDAVHRIGGAIGGSGAQPTRAGPAPQWCRASV
ncbi:hypothetical protein [Giesbergeria anulus]|uniref:hypothetical protein n=1 Tax=Giesbergeria anulus TaxID=180197 RepID=UPI001C431A0B